MTPIKMLVSTDVANSLMTALTILGRKKPWVFFLVMKLACISTGLKSLVKFRDLVLFYFSLFHLENMRIMKLLLLANFIFTSILRSK